MSQEDSLNADIRANASAQAAANSGEADDQVASSPAVARKSGASISRLTAAFANMMGTRGKDARNNSKASKAVTDDASGEFDSSQERVTPRGIIEAILFVGLPSSDPSSSPNGEALPAETIAGAMRDVSIQEVAKEIEALNEQYEQDASPYRVETTEVGYRMVLSEAFQPLRERFHGGVRSAKLSPAAIEVLSIVAYRQPIRAEEISDLREERSTAAITQLVRRGLLEAFEVEPTLEPIKQSLTRLTGSTAKIEKSQPKKRPSDNPVVMYRTTQRLLEILELDAINQLPQVTEHDD